MLKKIASIVKLFFSNNSKNQISHTKNWDLTICIFCHFGQFICFLERQLITFLHKSRLKPKFYVYKFYQNEMMHIKYYLLWSLDLGENRL